MARWFLFSLLLFSTFWLGAQHCGSDLLTNTQEQQERIARTEAFTARWIADRPAIAREVLSIPVVVHVVYQDEDDNIPESYIYDAIEALNADFRALNDLSIVPDEFSDLIADTEIEFCIAATPNANQPAIMKTQTDVTNIGVASTNGQRRIFYSELGGSTPADVSQYLNLYVCDMGGIIGQGIYPDNAEGQEDGVLINFSVFGRGDYLDPPYDLGRTLTHEVGHYLNLRHIWGSSISDCSEDDLVNDTPNSGKNYLGDCVASGNSCGSNDMPTNFMYYTDDACMANFTPGQKLRMMATLAGPRAGLGNADCVAVATQEPQWAASVRVFPNPVRERLFVELPIGHSATLRLRNALGQSVRTGISGAGMPTTELPSGLYFLEIRIQEETLIKRVVVP